jgi:chaperonin cofactor prefoldin
MTDFQLSVLQQDSQELREYITELTAKGKSTLVAKLSKKLEFLESRIAVHI